MRSKFASMLLCCLILVSLLLVFSSEMLMVSALPEKYPKWQYQTVGTVNSVVVSGNGAYVVSSSSDGYLYLFSTNDSMPLDAVNIGGSATVLDVSFNGTYVAAAFQNTLKVYTVSNNKLQAIASFTNNPGNYGGINSLSFSADGRYLAIGTWANYATSTSYVHIFDALLNTTVWSRAIANPGYPGYYDYVTVDFSSDGNYIAAGSTWNQHTYLYSKQNSTALIDYNTANPVNSVSISGDGQYFVAGGNVIYYFNKNLTAPIWSRNVGSSIVSTSLSSTADNVLASSGSGYIHLLTGNNTLSKTVATYTAINKVSFSGNDRFFLGIGGSQVFLYSLDVDGNPDTTQLEPLWSFTTGYALTFAAVSADGRYAAVGSGTFLYLLDTLFAPDLLPTKITFSNNNPTEGDTVTIITTIRNNGTLASPATSIAFYDDDGLIGRKTAGVIAPNSDSNVSIVCYVSPAGSHTIRVIVDEYNVFLELDKTNNVLDRNILVSPFPLAPVGNPLVFVASITGTATCTALSGDGHYAVVGTSDSKLSLFLSNHSSAIWSYNFPNNVEHATISDNGNYIAASTANIVYCFSKDSPSTIASFTNNPGNYGGINSLSFSADGRYLAIGTWANYATSTSYVHIFDALLNTTVWSRAIANPGYPGYYDYVTVDFSSDGNYIAAGSTWNQHTYLYSKQNSTALIDYNTANPVNSVSISGDGQYFVAGGNVIYYFNKNVIVPLWTKSISGTVFSISISQDSSYIAATRGSVVYLVRNDGSQLWNTTVVANANEIALSLGGENCIVRAGNYVYLFNRAVDGNSTTPAYDPIWQYNTGNTVNGVAISGHGEYLGAASSGKLFYYSTLGQNFTVAVTNSANGQALAGADVTLFLSDGTSQIGTTNSQGIALISVSASKNVTGYRATLEGYNTVNSANPPTYTSFSISMSRTPITLQITMDNSQDTYPQSQNPISKIVTISNGYSPYSLRTFVNGGGYNNQELATVQMDSSSTTIILPFTSPSTYTVYFNATDRLGNSGTSQTYTVTIVPPPVVYTVTVRNSSNAVELNGVTVTLLCSDGSNYVAVSDSLGVASISVPAAKTVTGYSAVLSGYDTVISGNPPATTSFTISMIKTPPPIIYIVVVKDSSKGLALSSVSVTLLCSDGSSQLGTTNSTGVAVLSIPAAKTVTKCSASLSGYYPKEISVSSTAIEISLDVIPPPPKPPAPKNYTIIVRDQIEGGGIQGATVVLFCSDTKNYTGATNSSGVTIISVPGNVSVTGYQISKGGYDTANGTVGASSDLLVSLKTQPITLQVTVSSSKNSYTNKDLVTLTVSIRNGYLPYTVELFASGGKYQNGYSLTKLAIDSSQTTYNLAVTEVASYSIYATAMDNRNNTGTSLHLSVDIKEQPWWERTDFQIGIIIAIIAIAISGIGIAYAVKREKGKFVRVR